MRRMRRIGIAVGIGLGVHAAFAVAVGSMAWGLATGLQQPLAARSLEPDSAWWAWLDNVLLLAQFPLLHSWLLTRSGQRLLAALMPGGHGRTLAPSTYVVVGSLQLSATFWLWQPSGIVWHQPTGWTGAVQWSLFAAAWLFLVKALYDAGLGLQTGFAGWWALLRGRAVDYGPLPTSGLFARCRQPIYLGFALVLATAPTWSPDWLLLAVLWIAYCVVGPRWKEARWARIHGTRFLAYRQRVPYFLPRLGTRTEP